MQLKPEFANIEEPSDERTITDESNNESTEAPSQADFNDNTDIPDAADPEQNNSLEVDSENADDPQHSTPVQQDSQNSESSKGYCNYQEEDYVHPGSQNSGSFKGDSKYEEEEHVQMSHSILFSDQTRILKFIEMNAPKDRTPEVSYHLILYAVG